MPLFGLCPAQDEFYLVVCETCKQVVKPQALLRHMGMNYLGYFCITVGFHCTVDV